MRTTDSSVGVLSQFLKRFLVFGRLSPLVCDHALHRRTSGSQSGPPPCFFCGGQLSLSPLAWDRALALIESLLPLRPPRPRTRRPLLLHSPTRRVVVIVSPPSAHNMLN